MAVTGLRVDGSAQRGLGGSDIYLVRFGKRPGLLVWLTVLGGGTAVEVWLLVALPESVQALLA